MVYGRGEIEGPVMKLMGILDGLEDEEKTGFMEIIIMQGAFVVNIGVWSV